MELLLLAPLLGWMLIIGRLLDTSPARSLLLAVSAIVLLLYTGGLVGALPMVRLAVLAAGLLLLMTEILRHRATSLARLTSLPILVWLGLAVVYFALHSGGHFRFYDEYSHWGIHLKEMLALNGYWDASSNSLHPRYPPGPTLWQYLFFVFRPFNDGLAYFAQFLLLITPLMILFEGVGGRSSEALRDNKQQRWSTQNPIGSVFWIVAITTLILLSLASLGHGIASLYVDHVLGAWIAGLVVAVITTTDRPSLSRHLPLLMPLVVLALIKDVGFFFALALAAIFALLLLLRTLDSRPPRWRWRKPAVLLAIWVIGSLLVTLAWTANRDAASAPADVMSVAGLAGIVTGSTRFDDPERAALVRARFTEMFTGHPLAKTRASYRYNESSYATMDELGKGGSPTTAGFFVLYVLAGAAMLAVVLPPGKRIEWGIVYASFLGLAAGYLLMLYLSYQFVFPRRDGLNIASYVRYVHSIALPMWLLMLTPLLPVARLDQSTATARHALVRPAAMLIVIATLLIVARPYLTPLYRPVAMPAFRADVAPFARQVQTIARRAPVWVLFPEPNEHRLLSSILLHEITPTPARIENDLELLASEASFRAALAGYTYAWIVADSPAVRDAVLNMAGQLSPASLYEITADPAGPGLVALAPDGGRLTN